jgi:hypothetical protein
MPVGLLLVLSFFSTCKLFLLPFALDCLHCFFLLELQYGIAKYLYRYLLLVYGWLGFHWTFIVCFIPPICGPYVLIYHPCVYEAMTRVWSLSMSFWNCIYLRGAMHPQWKIQPRSIVAQKICYLLHIEKTLIGIVGDVVVNILLLVSMLVGLLHHVHKSSTSLWHLLYQQVIAFFLLVQDVDIHQVHHLDSVSGYCRGACCCQSVSVACCLII